MKYEKSCGAVVYRINNDKMEFLILKHINGGHWGFPKGHVENDETEHETALREVFEESGLDVKIMDDFRYTMKYSPKEGVIKEVVFFAAKAEDDKVNYQIEEIEDYQWLQYEEALKAVSYDNTRELLKSAYKFIKER